MPAADFAYMMACTPVPFGFSGERSLPFKLPFVTILRRLRMLNLPVYKMTLDKNVRCVYT